MGNKTDNLDFKVNDGWTKFKKENPWVAFVPEFAEDSDGQKYMRALGRQVIYKAVGQDEKENHGYKCNCCGTNILSATVAHPIHDGPWPGSGSGQCRYEQVPYCPKCEETPSSSGAPIESGREIWGWNQ